MMRRRGEPGERRDAPREYGVEEGIHETVRRAEELLLTQPYVVIGFNSFGQDVGKTTVGARVCTELNQRGIPAEDLQEPDYLGGHRLDSFRWNQQVLGKVDRGVVVLSAFEGSLIEEAGHKDRSHMDLYVKEKATSAGLHGVEKVDIRVALYRPDTLFTIITPTGERITKPLLQAGRPVGDILIRNELAVNKSSIYKGNYKK